MVDGRRAQTEEKGGVCVSSSKQCSSNIQAAQHLAPWRACMDHEASQLHRVASTVPEADAQTPWFRAWGEREGDEDRHQQRARCVQQQPLKNFWPAPISSRTALTFSACWSAPKSNGPPGPPPGKPCMAAAAAVAGGARERRTRLDLCALALLSVSAFALANNVRKENRNEWSCWLPLSWLKTCCGSKAAHPNPTRDAGARVPTGRRARTRKAPVLLHGSGRRPLLA